MPRPASSSSVITSISPTKQPSRATSAHCGRRTGSSMPSVRSPGQSRCWPTFPATPIGVAISNSRLISADADGVTFKYKDYRLEGPDRYRTMTLEPGEFIRRFLMHVLPKGFHRIRHFGLLANGGDTRAEKLARARELIAAPGQLAPPPQPPQDRTCDDTTLSEELDHPCPHCGSRMVIIETFEPGHRPRHRPSAPVIVIGINTS